MTQDYSAWVGKSMEQRDRVSASALARWCATLDRAVPQSHVPQAYHWCLCLPEAATAELGEDGHPKRGGFLPPVDLPRRMWASSAVEFLAPIPIDSDILRTSTIASVTQKTGGSGTLVFVEVDHGTRAGNIDCVRERQSIVYRAAPAAPMPPSAPPRDVDLSEWTWQRSLVPHAPLLFRFSALTFNSHRIHYDLPYARDVEGYPGLVVHGPLTATMLVELCARELGKQPLATFSFRGQAPAFADETLHLVGKRDGDSITLAALGADGRTVMSATGKARA